MFVQRAAMAAFTCLLLGACSGEVSRSFSADGITIDAQVVDEAERSVLHLALTPKDGARLASRPGIKLRPAESDVSWLIDMPLVRETKENGYFSGAQEFSVPFDGEGAASTIVLDVEYAYCQSDLLCIRSETTIEIPRA